MRKSNVLKNSLNCSVLFLISSLNSLTSSSCPCLYTMYISNFPSLFPSSQSICFMLFHLFSILIKSLEFFLASLNSFPLSESISLPPPHLSFHPPLFPAGSIWRFVLLGVTCVSINAVCEPHQCCRGRKFEHSMITISNTGEKRWEGRWQRQGKRQEWQIRNLGKSCCNQLKWWKKYSMVAWENRQQILQHCNNSILNWIKQYDYTPVFVFLPRLIVYIVGSIRTDSVWKSDI